MVSVKIKSLLSDKTFLILAWPHIIGGLSQGIVSFGLLIALVLFSSSMNIFVNSLSIMIKDIVGWTTFFVIILNISFLFINGIVIKYYQTAPPIGSDESKFSLQDVKIEFSKDKEIQRFFQYFVPSSIIVIFFLDFLRYYYSEAVVFNVGVGLALMSTLPLSLGLTFAYFSRIIVEFIILLIRLYIQNEY